MPWFFHALAPEAEQQKRAGARVCGEVNNNLIGRAGNSWRIVLHTEAEAAETQSQGLSMPVSLAQEGAVAIAHLNAARGCSNPLLLTAEEGIGRGACSYSSWPV